jgi:hypothetical protein
VNLGRHVGCTFNSALMMHFFKAAPDQVRWELTAMAVIRFQELEDLLARARGPDDVTPVGVPS